MPSAASRLLAASLLLALAATLPLAAAAHHTYVAKYDAQKLIKLAGTITAVRYANPHIFFDLDVSGTTWTIETESIPVAQTNGLTQALLVAGAKVTVSGWPSREKGAELGLNTISFAGGKTIVMRKTAR
ncbi:MAG: DUF6152 family protein [Pseudomonadota bacterium]